MHRQSCPLTPHTPPPKTENKQKSLTRLSPCSFSSPHFNSSRPHSPQLHNPYAAPSFLVAVSHNPPSNRKYTFPSSQYVSVRPSVPKPVSRLSTPSMRPAPDGYRTAVTRVLSSMLNRLPRVSVCQAADGVEMHCCRSWRETVGGLVEGSNMGARRTYSCSSHGRSLQIAR
jgi:hypothetical protein